MQPQEPGRNYSPQYGDAIRREQIKSAVPLQAAQKAAPPPPPAAPQPPVGGSAAGQPNEEEFLSPFAAANISYEESVALFNLQVLANMAVDERSHPEMQELYWAAKQDLEAIRGGNTQKSATEASGERSEGKKKQADQPKDK